MINIRKFLLVFGLLFWGSISGLSQQAEKITGIYTSLEYNDESGDLSGVEVFIIYAEDYWVLFQESFGEPSTPVLTKAKINGTNIEFVVPGVDGKSRVFKGKIMRDYLTGKFSNEKKAIRLPRKKSYWQ